MLLKLIAYAKEQGLNVVVTATSGRDVSSSSSRNLIHDFSLPNRFNRILREVWIQGGSAVHLVGGRDQECESDHALCPTLAFTKCRYLESRLT